ncbi:MAG TPA: hypothetical protein VJT73_02265 [Polyangiaceae bacterium]|nr:hypothetical protein [Polyangiaceae bacterium]
MANRAYSRFAHLVARANRNRAATLLGAVALAASAYVIAYPFWVVTYPPITDFPFHGAEIAIFRHYFDPTWHFREQFSLHLFDAPYLSMYVVGLVFAFFTSPLAATKGMAIVMLALMPAGLAVMFHGMKKSPLWGLLGLELVWCTLTHWGFLNFMGAIGLFAAVIGFTLLALDRPSRSRVAWLTGALLAVFFTHIYRFPFAVAVVVGTAVVMYPATRRIRPVVVPVAVALVVFGLWRVFRRATLGSDVGPLTLHWERTSEIPAHMFGGWLSPTEQILAQQMLYATAALFVVSALLFFAQGRFRRRSSRSWWWGIGVTALPLGVAAVYMACYFVLPMSIGTWWFVYPREAVTAAFIALGVFPDMPRQWWLKMPLVAAVVAISGRVALFNAEQWHEYDASTEDFRAVERSIQHSPKLMYLVFDHSGSTRSSTPFIHLPAWVQANKGGWLSWHFVGWDLHPIRYRENDPQVPPPRPPRWEWTPERFDLRADGPWFDTFLVRNRSDPGYLFAGDPSIEFVTHSGTWWLYRRQ